MTTGKARRMSLRGLAKIGVVLCCGMAYASPVGDAIGPYVDGGELPGAVSVVVDAKGKATVDCRGYADLEAKTPMRPDSIFWLASNTKAIAAATLMTLVDEGKVNLDDPVAKYLPEFADVKVAAKDGPHTPVRPMTVRMTLSHMSGLPFFPGMPIDKRPIAELAHLAATTPLAADPGERYAYSNWGIDVAMAVVEKVTGRSFAVVMKERILAPLGMKDTTFVPSEEQMTRLVKSYRLSDNLKPREIKIGQFSYPYTDPTREPEGGGGLFGTADDLCRFFRMLAAGGTAPDGRRILSEQAVREMTRRQTPNRPKITSYGFGLNVKPNCVGHGGAYGTYAAFDPQTKAVRVLCISMSGTTKQRTAFQAAWNKASLAGTAAFLPEGKIDYIVPLTAPQYWNGANVRQIPFATLTLTIANDRRIYFAPTASGSFDYVGTSWDVHDEEAFQAKLAGGYFPPVSYLMRYDLKKKQREALGLMVTDDGCLCFGMGGACTGQKDGRIYFVGAVEEKDEKAVVGKVSRRWPFSMALVAYDPAQEKRDDN